MLLLTQETAAQPSAWDTWSAFAEEPALLEFLLVAAVGIVILLTNLRLARLVKETRSRAAVKDYLLGIEQAMQGDPAGAKQRLERVLAEDPENHHARLMYGEVLAELGEPAEAHRQHLFLRKAFQLESARNDLGLAQNLLDVGRPAEAVEAARRAAEAEPQSQAILEVLFRAELAAGFPEDAGRTGAQLARLSNDEAERTRVRGRAAAALSLAAGVKLDADDRTAARALCDQARALDPDSRDARRVAARLILANEGRDGLTKLLGDSSEAPALPRSSVPRLGQASELPAVVEQSGQLLSALAHRSAYRCSTCGGGAQTAQLICAYCGAEGTVQPMEAGLFGGLESASLVMDEVDANRAHIRRQLEAAVDGDVEAAQDLLEIGSVAVEHLLSAAVREPRTTEVVVSLLRRMGPPILPALFAGYARLKELRLRNLGTLLNSGAGVGVMGRVVQGFGREALEYFEGLLETKDRDLRKILVDYYIGLGDQQEFHKLLDHFPPVEVIHRLNAAETGALRGLLRTVEGDSFLARGLLAESIFQRDEDLVHSVAEASHPDTLIQVLEVRGYSPRLTELLVDHLADSPLADAAGRVLDSYGQAALDHLLFAFADLDRPTGVRQALKSRIRAMGPVVVPHVCRLVGPAASALDEDVVDLLGGIGAAAAEPLSATYLKSSLVEKLGGSLVGRYTHRRVTIIRALRSVQGTAALERLRETETDPNLKLRLSQALRDEPGTPNPEENHGQAG